jgi:hypothetical protein
MDGISMKWNLNKVYRAASGLCIGYAFCHIFIEYFLIELVFGPLNIRIASGWGTDVDSEQVLGILILGAVLSNLTKTDEKLYQLCTLIGMGVWVFVGVLMEM